MQSTMLGKAHCSPLATANLSSSGVVEAPTERMESYKNMKVLHVHGYYIPAKINSKQEYGALEHARSIQIVEIAESNLELSL